MKKKIVVKKCCLKYGDLITEELNRRLDKAIKHKRHDSYLRAIGKILYDFTGNVNNYMRLVMYRKEG